MIIFKAKVGKIGGTSYRELIKKARAIYHQIQKKSRRSTYVRSAYLKKDKIFIDLFWEHLNQKPKRDRIRRLKFFNCAIDLI